MADWLCPHGHVTLCDYAEQCATKLAAELLVEQELRAKQERGAIEYAKKWVDVSKRLEALEAKVKEGIPQAYLFMYEAEQEWRIKSESNLAVADKLIGDLLEHEGAEGFSTGLRERADKFLGRSR